MIFLKKVMCYAAAVTVVMVPVSALSAEKKTTPPLIEMLQNGKAMLSNDKKVLLDEKGEIIARQKSSPELGKSSATTPDKSGSAAAEIPYICTPICAIWVKRCYNDPKGFEVCINLCEKEMFQCE